MGGEATAILILEEGDLAVPGVVRGHPHRRGSGTTPIRVVRLAVAIGTSREVVEAVLVTTAIIGDPGLAQPLPHILRDLTPGALTCNGLAGLLMPRPDRRVTRRHEAGPEARQEKGYESDLARHMVIVRAVQEPKIGAGAARDLCPPGLPPGPGLRPGPGPLIVGPHHRRDDDAHSRPRCLREMSHEVADEDIPQAQTRQGATAVPVVLGPDPTHPMVAAKVAA